jgi:hypothetical protein
VAIFVKEAIIVGLHKRERISCPAETVGFSTRTPFRGIHKLNPSLSVKVGPCHHGMARPQVADGGTVSSYGG